MSPIPKNNSNKRIAVVGGGIFGLTAALWLDAAGFAVDVYESREDILLGASGANQLRSHRGYHYPRSSETIISCNQSTPRFEEAFSSAIVKDAKRFYAIPTEGSRVRPEEYLRILDEHQLPYTVSECVLLDPSKISLVIEVKEHAIDIHALKREFKQRLDASRVRMIFNTTATEQTTQAYDTVIVAAYGHLNEFFGENSEHQKVYQYELCEKPLVRLPEEFKDISLVIIDGPFFCLDPYGTTGLHLLGSVEHAIHHRETSKGMHTPTHLADFLHRGLISVPSHSNIEAFLGLIREFIPSLGDVEHIGSFYTIR